MLNHKLKGITGFTLSVLLGLVLLVPLAFSSTAEDELGTQVYKKRCQMCHGTDGLGETKAGKAMKTPDITKVEWKNGNKVADLEKTLREGLGKMPKYEGKLSDEEITAVAEFVVAKFAH